MEELLVAHPFPVPRGSKDDRGTLLIVGGPPECPGAVRLAASAALRTGTGRVQVVVHPDVTAPLAVTMPELLVLGWDLEGAVPAAVRSRLAHATSVIVGPGLTGDPGAAVDDLAELVSDRSLLLDAGALPAVERMRERRGVVIAPNESEARELAGDSDAVPSDLAIRLAKELRRAVIVRGAGSVLATPGGDSWQHDGVEALGTPGSGDVFVGALGGLLARGVEPVGAMAWATVLHADAGRILEARRPVGGLARDLADTLPDALTPRLA